MTSAEPTAAATGHCLCGDVSFVIAGPVGDVLHCHCENCRRIHGSMASGVGCATDDLVVSDPDALLWYDVGYAAYGSCRRCGSSMFWRGAEHPHRTSVQAGVLDDASGSRLGAVWFASEAQPHHVLDPNVPHFERNGTY